MLSAESASGNFPREAVAMMDSIIRESRATSTSMHLPMRGTGNPALRMPMRSVLPCDWLQDGPGESDCRLYAIGVHQHAGRSGAPRGSNPQSDATDRDRAPVDPGMGIHSVVWRMNHR